MRNLLAVTNSRILLIGILFFPLVVEAQIKQGRVRLEDHSDWWSVLNESFQTPKARRLDKDLAAGNFEVAGVSLDYDPSFKSIQNKFGHADIIERGDASTGRQQICYLSEQSPETHLIFEQGEVNLVFYLLAGGRHWDGEDLCAKSRVVTASTSTMSGLRLGISRDELEEVLGKSDLSDNEKLIYVRDVKKQTSPTELARLRTQNSKLSEKDFHETYDSYYLSIYIEARFLNSKLTYLAISKAETN